MRAVCLLTFWKFKNSLRTLFRDPRKLIPFLVLVLVFGMSVAGYGLLISEGNAFRRGHVEVAPSWSMIFLAMIATGFLVLDTGFNDGLLAFPMSDVDYLFPSPISRRAVIAYRLPALLFSVLFLGGTALFMVRFLTQTFTSGTPGTPPPFPPGVTIWAVFIGVGTYMNLATAFAMRMPERRGMRKFLWIAFLVLALAAALLRWQGGHRALEAATTALPLRILFLPSALITQVMVDSQMHRAVVTPMLWLGFLYALSFVPIFTTDSNWYEQSIANSERFSRLRAAAKGGYASLAAAKAVEAKPRRRRTEGYTVRPFGQGTMALFWAHLSAAAKRPFLNFGAPLLVGISAGAAGGVFGAAFPSGAGQGMLMPLVIYANILFLGSAKTASEAAIRRREILVPLPIGGWQSVAANLGVPAISGTLFFTCSGLAYMVFGAPEWPLVGFGLAVVLPIRLVTRMILQYIVVLAYSDFADKTQQFLAQFVSYLLNLPLLVLEVIVCIPAFVLHSFWIGLGALLVLECILLPILLAAAGRASDRAIAAGEPVGFWRLMRA